MKKRSKSRKHCALAVVRRSQKNRPAADPLPGGAGRPKFNQLEMVIVPSLQNQFGEDRCTQFRVIVVTDPQTHTQTNRQTHRQDRLQYTAPQLAGVQCNYCRIQFCSELPRNPVSLRS